MISNYIGGLQNYSNSHNPLEFFAYIAGGFGNSFEAQLNGIVKEAGVNGFGMSVDNMIRLVIATRIKAIPIKLSKTFSL